MTLPGNWLQGLRMNPSRKRLEEFIKRAAAWFPAKARVLDAGSGEGLYKRYFSHCAYESTDFGKVDKPYGELSYISDLANLPLAGNSYDFIICTQVLEHLPEPGRVLSEFQRVLKPGGELWLSASFFFAEHDLPYDFFRYTRYGLRHLAQKAGFRVLEIDWLEGYLGSLAYQFESAARYLPLNHPVPGQPVLVRLAIGITLFLVRGVSFVFSLLLSRLELIDKISDRGFGKNFTLVAGKETPPIPPFEA